jgi:ATP-dependent RNA helicase DeaD
MADSGFNELGLSDESLHAIKSKGFEEPTEIQKKIIPLILKNEVDLIGQAQTGTGKTAAFALPIIEQLQTRVNYIQALIIVPTRELAIQVAEEFNSLRGQKNIHVAPIYGGQSYDTQLRRLKKGVDVVVGTPGRMIDLLNRSVFALDQISFVVLDEADEMLNMGFIDDIETILSKTNKTKRTLLFSATMPERILSLTKKYMGKREVIKAKNAGHTTALTDQIYFEVKESDKFDALCRIVDTTVEFYGLIFCRTKNDVDHVSSKLSDRGFDCEGLHGDISQNQREKILDKFKKKKTNVLVATDVAARGLDIDFLTHVINYALPQDPEAYLHRIGRTGRAGKEGTAITFVTPEEYRKLMFIKNITQTEIRKERIPQVQDVIDFKRKNISVELQTLIGGEISKDYYKLAEELIEGHTPIDVIAALIKAKYQDELEEGRYAKIQDLYEGKKREFSSSSRGDSSRRGQSRGDSRDRFHDDDRSEGSRRKPRSTKGKARLFFAMGKKDDLSPRKLLDMLQNKANVDSRNVDDIQVFDTYSFMTVPNKESDLILEIFNKNRGKRPLVEKAKK